MAKKLTHDEYLITLATSIWTPLEQYISARAKILHRCDRGHETYLLPRQAQNNGCQKCKSEKERTTPEDYAKRLSSIKWTALEPYVTIRTKILHICSNGHKSRISPNHAQRDVGCVECNASLDVPGMLYYIRLLINDRIYYKIGVTSKPTVKARFYGNLDKIDKVIMEKRFDKVSEAFAEERQILNKFHKDRSSAKLLHNTKGNTEIFDYDILNMDT